MNWRRDEIDIGQRFMHEDHTTVYEVVAIIERPLVVLRPVGSRTGVTSGIPDIHQVIDSDTFSFWKKVRLEGPQR